MKLFCLLLCILFYSFFTFANHGEIVQLNWDTHYRVNANETAYSNIPTVDGGQIWVGKTSAKGAGKVDGWIYKTDLVGNVLWERTIGGKEDDILQDIVPTKDGGFLVSGSTNSKGNGSFDVWLLKVNAAGILEWHSTYGTKNSEQGGRLLVNGNGDYILAATRQFGNYEMTLSSSAYHLKHFIWLMKFDDKGTILFDERVPVAENINITDLHQTLEGGYILSGVSANTENKVTPSEAFILKLDTQGIIVWKRWIKNGAASNMIHDILPLQNNTYLLAGHAVNKLNQEDVNGLVVFIDGMGNIIWEKLYGTIGTNVEAFHEISLTKDYQIMLKGKRYQDDMHTNSPEWNVIMNVHGDVLWQE